MHTRERYIALCREEVDLGTDEDVDLSLRGTSWRSVIAATLAFIQRPEHVQPYEDHHLFTADDLARLGRRFVRRLRSFQQSLVEGGRLDGPHHWDWSMVAHD